MGQYDDIVSIKQWGIYILLDHYYNVAPEQIITQSLSVLGNSYPHERQQSLYTDNGGYRQVTAGSSMS